MPVEILIESRLAELGLRRPELIARLGYKNVSGGLRGLQRFCAGDFERYSGLIPKLPGALELALKTVATAVAKSQEEINEKERKAREEEERIWRESFQPHAVVVPERSVPCPIWLAAICEADRQLIIPVDKSRPRSTFIRQALN